MHDEYKDIFTGNGCFKGTFSLQVKDDAKPYQLPLRHIAHPLQEPFKKEPDRLQKHQILAPLKVGEKPNGATALS